MDYNERVRRLNKIDVLKDLTNDEKVKLQRAVVHFNKPKRGGLNDV